MDEDGAGERGSSRTGLAPTPSLKGRGFGGLAKPWSKWTAETERAFLLALRLTGQVRKAAAEIGRSRSAAQARRRTNPAFAAAWDAAIAEQQVAWAAASAARLGPGLDGPEDREGGGRLTRYVERRDGWDARKRGLFLRTLARTKNVAEACRAAGMSNSAAYYLRGQSVRFAAAWEKALRDPTMPSVMEAVFERAVRGWSEPIVSGGAVIGERRRYSEGLLRDLLRIEMARAAKAAEADAERQSAAPDIEAVRASILRKIEAIDAHEARETAKRQAADELRRRACWGHFGPRAGAWMALEEGEGTDPAS